jgi:SAM-dependent methyltransferase
VPYLMESHGNTEGGTLRPGASLKSRLGRIPLAASSYHLLRSAVSLLNFCYLGSDFLRFRLLSRRQGSRFPATCTDIWPCLEDRTRNATFDRHYLLHTAWAARALRDINPEHHVDVGSSLPFVSVLSAFIPVRFYDYRPAELTLNNLECGFADLLALPFEDNSIASLSCMHVLEHVGLGRYGDRLDPNGDLKAIAELKRVVAPGGNLLLVVPIGRPKIQFNAHRIYSYEQIAAYFSDLRLNSFALIPDTRRDGDLVLKATKEMADKQYYACGCFRFQKGD